MGSKLRWSPSATKSVLALGAIVVVLSACQGVVAGAFNAQVPLALALVVLSSLAWGAALCELLGLRDDDGIDLLHALLLGMVVVGTLLTVLGLTSPLGVAGNFVLVAAMVLGLHLYLRHRAGKASGLQRPVLYLEAAGLFTVLMAVVAAVCWSSENLRGIRQIGPDLLESYPWQDVFGQTANIIRFMNPGGAPSLGDEMLLGSPLPLYHYGSYLIPAFVGRFSGAQAYTLTTGILPTLGILWTGLAAWVLGCACADRRVGAVAAMGVLFMPDPSFWGLGNRWTSYFFFQQVGTNALYCVAILALATAHGLRAVQKGSVALLVSAAVLIAVAGLYKVQVVLVYGLPLWLLMLWFFRHHRMRASLAAMVLSVLVYAGLLALMERLPGTPTLTFGSSGILMNMRQIAGNFPPAVADWLMPFFPSSAPYLPTLLHAIPMVLVTTYGLWLAALVAAVGFFRPTDPTRRFVLALVVVSLVMHLVVACTVAPNASGRGDAFEIMHKSFVWPYFAVALSCSIMAGIWWTGVRQTLPALQARIALAMACAVAVAIAALLGATTMSAIPWSARAMKVKFPRDLYEAASYLRTHTPADVVVQYFENDSLLMLVALSERRSFVIQCVINCPPPTPAMHAHVGQLVNALEQPDIAAVRGAARALGIDWLVLRGRTRDWQAAPAAVPDAAFGEFLLYATQPH